MAEFKFIDLFAGIGGIRLGMENAGGKCILTAEIDRFARKTYQTFFQDGDDHIFIEDITSISASDLPDHDVLCAGFPCQPFSLAGVSKKNSLGRSHGFDDPTKGTLFFNVKEMLLEKQPRAFLLENVKNLMSHDSGNTFEVIADALKQAGYVFSAEIIDSSKVVPQHRQRVYIVGFRADAFGLTAHDVLDWKPFWDGVYDHLQKAHAAQAEQYEEKPENWPRVGAILEKKPDSKYTLTKPLWTYLQAYKEKHRKAGNGFGYGTVNADSPRTRTLSARYHKDGAEILVEQGSGTPRRLTPKECARIQGFPEKFQDMFGTANQPVSDTQAYRQFGNSVTVPVIEAVATQMNQVLNSDSFLMWLTTQPNLRFETSPLEPCLAASSP